MQRVGVIGLGKMGLPIARNLMDRGFEVIGYRRHGSPELVEAGGGLAGPAAEVASRSDVLLSIVPDTAAVSDIVCGEAGTLTTLRPGTVHIEMSTIDVGRKSAIRDAVQRRGGDVLDCPISGSPAMVAPRLAMVCTVAELIAAASKVATLEPGDVIATGTPSGVGAGRGLYLRAGDVVRTSIEGLGTLENTVVNPSGGTS